MSNVHEPTMGPALFRRSRCGAMSAALSECSLSMFFFEQQVLLVKSPQLDTVGCIFP